MIDNIMKTATHFSARRLVMTLLALLCTTVTSLAQLNGEGTKASPYLYYVIDYTYTGLPVQGVPALTEAPKNTISRVYIEDRCNYYVPGAEISNDKVTYYGWTLTQGTDYLINIVSTSADNKMVYKGINEYGGSFSKDVDPTYQLNVTTWDASAKTGWHAISSPVDHQTFATTNHLTLAEKHNIYRYDESKRQWQEYRNEANIFNEFENSRGYIYRTDDNGGNIGFNGTVNTGNVDCELSYTEKSDNLAGFNLIDRMTGNDIDMLTEDEYSFVSSSSDNADRFIVKLSNDVTSTSSMSDSFVWQNGSEIIVDGQGQLQIFDVTGRMLSTMTINGQQSIDALSTGIYIFRMIGETIKTQKIIVK